MYSVSTTIQNRSSKPRRVTFVRANLCIVSSQAAAETALAGRTLFFLTAEKWRQINAALDAPAREIPALRKLFTKRSVFKAA
jgi:uncharacterized protein (DUF1778 family)